MLGDEHKKTIMLLVLLFGVVLFTAFTQTDTWNDIIGIPSEEEPIVRTYSDAPVLSIDESKDYVATIKTAKGDITVDLLEKVAPNTVNNFIFLSENNFYDGLVFHRIIKDFMIQGGDPKGDGSGGPGYDFEDEITDEKIQAGTLAMANRGPNTNGSQFFIVTEKDQPALQGGYTVFGTVTEGMESVSSIASVDVVANRYGEVSQPVENVIIDDIIISTK